MKKIKNWLVSEYEQAGIEDLKIDSVMGALNSTVAEIKEKGLYDKRFALSKNLSVLLYGSGAVEVHINRPELSNFELFTNVKSDSDEWGAL
jgi:hypothetical protein